MFCNKCGTIVPDDSSFCHKCGYKFEIPENDIQNSESTVVLNPAPQPIAPPRPATPQPQVYQTPQPVAPQPMPPQPQYQQPVYTQPVPPQPQYQQPVYTQPIAPQPQYQQPVLQPQPQMPYSPPMGTMRFASHKLFDAKKTATKVAAFNFLVPLFYIGFVVIFGLLSALIQNTAVINVISGIITPFLIPLAFFLSYSIFSKKHKDKAPNAIWFVSYLAWQMMYTVWYSIMHVDNPEVVSPMSFAKIIGSLIFATVMSYILDIGFLFSAYSRYDNIGNIIPDKLLRKDGKPLGNNYIIMVSVASTVTTLISLVIWEILSNTQNIGVLSKGIFPILIKYFISIFASILMISIFFPRKKYAESVGLLRFVAAGVCYIPISLFALVPNTTLATIIGILIKCSVSFIAMYFLLKGLAEPAHKFPLESVTEEKSATIQ